MKYRLFDFMINMVVDFIIAFTCMLLQEHRTLKQEHQKAIEAGVGKWVSDPVSGETEFKYGR